MSRWLLVILLSFGARLAVGGENWPQFRGPHGDGQAGAADLALDWSETKNVHWKVPIAGRGWSSPVIWGDQVWVTTASEDGHQMYAVAVERDTGKVLHNLLVFENEKPRFCHPTNSYASPTPVIEAGRIYVHFGSYGTACLDTGSGKKLWERRDLTCNHWRGPGSSPVLDQDALIVAYDGYDQQYVVAFDKKTGKTLWKRDRNIDYGTDNGDQKKAYGTCAIIEHAGRRQVISPSAVETVSYDPLTGKEWWRVRHGGMNAAARPLFGKGMVFIAAGSGSFSLIAVRPTGDGNVTDSHIVWKSGKSAPKRPSPLLLGDHLYMINDAGIASCLAAATGEIVWQKRLGGTYRASPIAAAGRIYCFGLEGQTPVIAAEPTYQLLAENQLDDGFQASPAVAGNQLFVRTTKHLYCLGKQD